jgi:myosin heavy chain 9/10/11/14
VWGSRSLLNPTVEIENEDVVGDEETLVDDETLKEVDIEITDDEDDSDGLEKGTGLKRKRTIRVIIRSRAFL